MNNLISVIVPIYKVEPYLRQCVDSIINQTYKNLEIILVDDGSPDRCPQICDEYAAKDNRIQVIHKENGGLSSARNAGLNIAIGDYIAFVDSDDYLDLTMYEELINEIILNKADVSVCNPLQVMDGKVQNNDSHGEREIIEERELIWKYLPSKLRFEVWNKLFKREVIGETRFKNGQIYEDLYFDRCVFSRVHTIVYNDVFLYYYRFNRPGATNSFFNEKRFIIFKELDEYITKFRTEGLEELSDIYRKYAMEISLIFYIQSKRTRSNSCVRDKIVNIFVSYFKVNNNNKLKYHIFRYSPMIYIILSKLIGVLRDKRI